jgi:hypothetical protein
LSTDWEKMLFCSVNKLCLSLILGFSQLVATNTQPDWCLQKISFFLDLSIIAKSFFVFMGTNENKDVRNISFNNYKPNFKK